MYFYGFLDVIQTDLFIFENKTRHFRISAYYAAYQNHFSCIKNVETIYMLLEKLGEVQ